MTPVASHAWIAAGRMDDGTPRLTCSTCGVGQHWPEVSPTCGAIRQEPKEHATARWKRERTMTRSDRAPNRVCAICSAAYHSVHTRSKYCSHPCAKSAWDTMHAASQRASSTRRKAAT